MRELRHRTSHGSLTRTFTTLAGTPLVIVATACGGADGGPLTLDFGDGGPTTTNHGSSSHGGGGASLDGGTDAPTLTLTPPAADCPPSATLIYLTGEGNALYSYDPTAGKFTSIGVLTCLDSPTHMTVDRSGTAWVVSDGKLYTASTTDASCTRLSNWTPDANQFSDFALTFLGTAKAVDTSLFIMGTEGELGSFDTMSGVVTNVGTVFLSDIGENADGSVGDMTTNGDGTLYLTYDALAPQTLNEVNPATGAVLHSWPTGHDDSGDSGALAYYGGLFYDFVGMSLYTFDPTTGATTSLGQAPIEVTGAGQSTCVPTVAPPPAVLH